MGKVSKLSNLLVKYSHNMNVVCLFCVVVYTANYTLFHHDINTIGNLNYIYNIEWYPEVFPSMRHRVMRFPLHYCLCKFNRDKMKTVK